MELTFLFSKRFKIFWMLMLLIFVHFVDSEPCSACKILVQTFQHGLKQTEKAHFGGGNTAWEQEKLGKYSRSETRLVEIMEHLCKKTDGISVDKKDEDKCHSMVEEFEEKIETWYFHKQVAFPDFFKWLCIESITVCCPENTWGKTCEPCPGESDRPCFGHGKCDGAGTRQGTGKCKCDAGYQGNLCRKCAMNYFSSFQNETHITCESCDVSCKGGCNGSGPSQCVDCKVGWSLIPNTGCEDVDECSNTNQCTGNNEICKNTPGSFQCVCAQGYKRESKECVLDITAPPAPPLFFGLFAEQILRYTAIFGLIVCLLVIVQRRSAGLWALFAITMVFVLMLEFTSIVNYIKNVTLFDNRNDAFNEF